MLEIFIRAFVVLVLWLLAGLWVWGLIRLQQDRYEERRRARLANRRRSEWNRN